MDSKVALDGRARSASWAPRLYGYDFFVSFALGPPPRGTQAYASDLVRRLRERNHVVFFSEDEMPVGEVLSAALRNALRRSRVLIVVCNREMLESPRWVRVEVDTFRRFHPTGLVVPISIDQALSNPEVVSEAESWLRFRDLVWLDEPAQAIGHGMASPEVVERLGKSLQHLGSSAKWIRTVVGTVLLLLALVVATTIAYVQAGASASDARRELRNALSLRLVGAAGTIHETQAERTRAFALKQLLAGARLGSSAEVQGALFAATVDLAHLLKTTDVLGEVTALAVKPDGSELLVGTDVGTLHFLDAKSLVPLADRHQQVDRPPPSNGSNYVSAEACEKEGDVADIAVREMQFNGAAIDTLSYSSDGRIAVVGRRDGLVQVWDAESRAPRGIATNLHPSGHFRRMALSTDSNLLATVGQFESRVCIWNRKDATFEFLTSWDIGSHASEIGALTFGSRDRKLIAIVKGLPYVFDLDTRLGTIHPLAALPLEGARPEFTAIHMSRDGQHTIAGDSGGTVWLWDEATRLAQSRRTTGLGRTLLAINGGNGGETDTVIVIGGDRRVHLWSSMEPTSLQETSLVLPTSAETFAASVRDRIVFTGNVNGEVDAWDAAHSLPSGAVRLGSRWHFPSARGQSIAFSANGDQLAALTSDGEGSMVRFDIGKLTNEQVFKSAEGVQVRFNLARNRFAVIRADGESSESEYVRSDDIDRIHLGWADSSSLAGDRSGTTWVAVRTREPDAAREKDEVKALAYVSFDLQREGTGRHYSNAAPLPSGEAARWKVVVVSEDGSLAAAAAENEIRIWDLRPHARLLRRQLVGGEDVVALALSSDGSELASLDAAGRLGLFQARSGALLGQLQMRLARTEWDSPAPILRFDYEGELLAVASKGLLRLLETKTSRFVGPSIQLSGSLNDMQFSPDGKHIALFGNEGGARLIPGAASWASKLCTKLASPMQPEEWAVQVSRTIAFEPTCQRFP